MTFCYLVRLFATTAHRIKRKPLLYFTSLLNDMIKDAEEQPDEELHRARCWRVLSTGASSLMMLEYIMIPGHCDL